MKLLITRLRLALATVLYRLADLIAPPEVLILLMPRPPLSAEPEAKNWLHANGLPPRGETAPGMEPIGRSNPLGHGHFEPIASEMQAHYLRRHDVVTDRSPCMADTVDE